MDDVKSRNHTRRGPGGEEDITETWLRPGGVHTRRRPGSLHTRPGGVVVFPRSLILQELENSRTVLNYLDNFGYLDGYASLKSKVKEEGSHEGDLTMMSTEDLEGALTLFQSMNSLFPTGNVDEEVLAQMKIPRCGVPDIDPDDPGALAQLGLETMQGTSGFKDGWRTSLFNIKPEDFVAFNKRYEVSDEKWLKNKLSFHIESISDTLDKHTFNEIVRAFEVWTESVELFLYEVKDKKIADIRIQFLEKDHGDKYPFDGPMGVLAHAFYPPSGEIHFDNDEEFTRLTNRGVNLRYTASHEFGHTLGLKHSVKKGSLMSPYHPGYTKEINLQQDDLEGISKIFKLGKGAVFTAETYEAMEYQRFQQNEFDGSQDNKPLAVNSPCIEEIDAVIQHPRKKTLFFFTKDIYYKVERDKLGEIGVVEGYPKYISEGWDGLESSIDAAYVNATLSAAFFFKGEQYWKYDFIQEKMYPGFPAATLPLVSKHLKATMMSGNTAYFFSGDKILKYESATNTVKTITDKHVESDAAFPLFVKGYFGTASGSTYSIYRVKNMEAVRVYHGRPLSWDYGLPMCVDHLMDHRVLNPKMKPFCNAYALLAFTDYNLDVPTECYGLVRPFPAFPLEEIHELEIQEEIQGLETIEL